MRGGGGRIRGQECPLQGTPEFTFPEVLAFIYLQALAAFDFSGPGDLGAAEGIFGLGSGILEYAKVALCRAEVGVGRVSAFLPIQLR